MLRSMKELEGYAIRATDCTIGHVRDFYFDDESWVIRYFIVDTGAWLRSRKVLISPIAIGHPNWSERALFVSLTKEQVRNSPTSTPNCRSRDNMKYATSAITATRTIGAVRGSGVGSTIPA